MTQSIITLQAVYNSLIFKFKSENELLKHIEKLSVNFTSQRDKLGEYLKDDKMVSAYSCFYLLTNIPKLKSCFDLLKFNLADYKDYEFFDIGAGPATFSLALLELNPQLKIRAVEKSELMIKQGNAFVEKIFPNADFKYQSLQTISPKTNRKRLGLFGHSANEMGPEVVIKYIENLKLDCVLFIEPGTKSFFQDFLKIRKNLMSSYSIVYPCLGNAPCPLSNEDWCHQYLSISHSAEVERLSQMAQKDRRKLPISLSFFKKHDDLPMSRISESQIVRVYPPTKYSIEWQICTHMNATSEIEAERNVVQDLQILFRGFSKTEIKTLKEVRAGERIKFTLEKKLSENKIRGKLI